ncbi:MAG: hypothetical protein J4F35_08405 [Candidatus Latescibacteria bacterium]|nr:hypothetical protein [Candidatus Latescibacterota bacterium]
MDAEIKEKVDQLRREGWCVLERIVPEDAIERVRAHVQEAHEKARQDTSGGRPAPTASRAFA